MHFGFLLKAAGRWNRRGKYGCLYTALTRDGALAELRKARARRAVRRGRPRDLVSVRVVRVSPVLDLTDPAERRKMRIPLSAATGDDAADIERCRDVADRARDAGYRALLVPSAAARGTVNLVIYTDAPASDLELESGPDRIAVDEV